MPEPKLMSEKIRETPDYVKTTRVTEVDCSCCSYKGKDDCYWCKRKNTSPQLRVSYITPCVTCKGTGRRNNTHTITQQKFWCIGGVLGTRKETQKFAGNDYVPFNRAKGRWSKGPEPKVVLIHKDLL